MTIIEMMIALGIFSVAMIAVLEVQWNLSRFQHTSTFSDNYNRTISVILQALNSQTCMLTFQNLAPLFNPATMPYTIGAGGVKLVNQNGPTNTVIIPDPTVVTDGMLYIAAFTNFVAGPPQQLSLYFNPANLTYNQQYLVNLAISATIQPVAGQPAQVGGNQTFSNNFIASFWFAGNTLTGCTCIMGTANCNLPGN